MGKNSKIVQGDDLVLEAAFYWNKPLYDTMTKQQQLNLLDVIQSVINDERKRLAEA